MPVFVTWDPSAVFSLSLSVAPLSLPHTQDGEPASTGRRRRRPGADGGSSDAELVGDSGSDDDDGGGGGGSEGGEGVDVEQETELQIAVQMAQEVVESFIR